MRLYKSFFKSNFYNVLFNFLNGYRWLVNAQYTGTFTRGGANAARKLREIVGLVKPVERRPPIVLVDEVVPVRDEIIDRAAAVAEWNAAIHASGGLRAHFRGAGILHELAPVLHALERRLGAPAFAINFKKCSRIAH